jgi:hypothetical protein
VRVWRGAALKRVSRLDGIWPYHVLRPGNVKAGGSREGVAVCACADELFARITSHCATVTITAALRYRYLLIVCSLDFRRSR